MYGIGTGLNISLSSSCISYNVPNGNTLTQPCSGEIALIAALLTVLLFLFCCVDGASPKGQYVSSPH